MKKKRLLIILFILTILTTNLAYAYSQEIGTARPYYQHPVTGVIEDPGNNPGIGQGMVETVLHTRALLEEVDGYYYLTVRYNLADNIKNESFAVQSRNDQDFYDVDYQVTQSTADTKDYRFIVPAKDAIIRSSFFVGPMGRDVIFYYDVSNYAPGNTDFVALGQDQAPAAAEPVVAQDPSPGPTQEPATSPAPSQESQVQEVEGQKPVTAAGLGEKIEVQGVDTSISAEKLGYDHGLLMRDSEELKELIPQKNKEKDKEQAKNQDTPQGPLGEVTRAFIQTALDLVKILTILLILGVVSSSLYLKKLKARKERLLEDLYEE